MPAQALLVPHDFVDRRQYLHARRTLTRLLELGTVPIINENDAIASDETRYGDNDRIAALVGHNIGAGVLVLLTDLDGLYTADPRVAADAQLVTRVRTDDPLLAIRAGSGGSGRGSGGMASKLEAARIASWSGVRTVIANAARAAVLAGAIADEPVGTTFEAHRRKLSARKLWIAFASEVAGRVTVDDGARRALVERQTSLLPAGVVEVAGASARAPRSTSPAPTAWRSPAGWCSSRPPSSAVAGHHTSDLPPGMAHEVIHRDDLCCCRRDLPIAIAATRAALSATRVGADGSPAARVGQTATPRTATLAHGASGRRGCRPWLDARSGRGAAAPTALRLGLGPPPRPSSARSSLRRLWASTLAVACSTSSTRDVTDVSLSSAVAFALA